MRRKVIVTKSFLLNIDRSSSVSLRNFLFICTIGSQANLDVLTYCAQHDPNGLDWTVKPQLNLNLLLGVGERVKSVKILEHVLGSLSYLIHNYAAVMEHHTDFHTCDLGDVRGPRLGCPIKPCRFVIAHLISKLSSSEIVDNFLMGYKTWLYYP